MKYCILSDLQNRMASGSRSTSTFCQKNFCAAKKTSPSLLCAISSLATAKHLFEFWGHELHVPRTEPFESWVFFLLMLQQQFILESGLGGSLQKKDPGLVINHKLNMSQQCHAVVKKADVR